MRKDEIIAYVVGAGIPKLLFELVRNFDENSGIFAITSSINSFSFKNGTVNGIGVLVIIGIVSFQLTSYLILQYYRKKIENDRLELVLASTDEILDHIDTYLVSKILREKLKTRYLLRKF
ncbi:hypothetical protein [Kordia sp.]|uniref:hypothetical protein n=1 Tax=Kordia sp. TaxID=1965332 RepID=UPI003D6B191B